MVENEIKHTLVYDQRKILELPPSAKFILYLLKLKGPMNRKWIIQETMMPDRTVGFALRLLLHEGLIERESYDDTRQRVAAQGRRRVRKQDRRITNYTLVSTLMPYEMIEV